MYDFWLPAYSIYLPVKHQKDGEVVSEESWDRRTREFTIRECGEKKNRGSGSNQDVCRHIACSLEHMEPQLRESEEVRAWVLDSAAVSLSPGYTSYYTYVTFQICKKADDNSNTYLIGLFWGCLEYMNMNPSAAEAQSLQSCLSLCDCMDCSLPGSTVHRDSPGKNTGMGCRALF